MKKFQNGFTKPEQSKRLLELGVPADSADLYYRFYTNLYEDTVMWDTPSVIAENQHIEWSHKLTSGDTAYMPCWSVGKLMDIALTCIKNKHTELCFIPANANKLVEQMMMCFEKHIDEMDFSKLEEYL